MPRLLNVQGHDVPLREEAVADLYARRAVYDCGPADDAGNGGHDLHLDPAHVFTLEDVEALLLAVDRRKEV